MVCETITYDCKLEMTGVNSFNENKAGQSGGAIYWAEVEPTFNTFNDLKFSKNFAAIYANDIGSIPAKLVGLSDDQYSSQMKRAQGMKLRSLQNSTN